MFTKIIKLCIGAFLLWVALPVVVTPYLSEEYRAMMNRSTAYAVYDRNGKSLGALPGIIDPHGDFDKGGLISEDHRSVIPKETANYAMYGTLLRTLEDRQLGSHRIRSINGIDVLRTLKAFLTGGRAGGGSGLTQQLYRNLHNKKPYNETTGEKFRRKMFELAMGPTLFRFLGSEGIVRAYASHIPLISSCRSVRLGGDVYGVELSAPVVFGHRFEDCSLAEIGILAAASWRPIIMERMPAGCAWMVKSERFEQLRERAMRAFEMAPKVFPAEISTDMADSAIATLAMMSPPQMTLSDSALWGNSVLLGLENATNPSRRALMFKAGMVESLFELSQMTGGNWRTVVREVQLSLDITMDLKVTAAVKQGIQQLEDDKAFDISFTKGPQNERAQIIVAVADQDGDLLGVYSNQDTPVYSRTSQRFIGSTGKIMAAIALGAAGFRPKTMLLNKSVGGIHNPNGDMGCRSSRRAGCMYPAIDVFAQSLNLPLIWALSKSSRTGVNLDGLVSDCGFQIAPTVPAATAITLGEIYTSPRQLHSLVSELLAVLDGDDRPAHPIRLVREVESFTEQNSWTSVKTSMPDGYRPNIRPYLQSEASRSFVREVLAAPFMPGGTFSHLGHFTPQHCDQIKLAIAKGGTVVTAAGEPATDILACGGMVLRNSKYNRITWIVVVRSPSPARPLGHVSSSTLQPLIAKILSLFVTD